jgi:tetratricopeptide (TPR) repeat protein
MRWGVALVVVLLATAARAQVGDPDVQAARRHFDRGTELYQADKYEEAMREFVLAKELRPAPAFDYNIGRCLDRLERWREAADAYDRYLASTGDSEETRELRERVAMLRKRAADHAPSDATPRPTTTPDAPATVVRGAPASKPVYKRAWFWIVIGGGVVAIATGVALGVTLGRGGDGDGTHPIMDIRF